MKLWCAMLGPVVALAAAIAAQRPLPPVVIDGEFLDWNGAPVVAEDPEESPDSQVDFRTVRAAADGQSLFFMIEVARPVNVQTLGGTLSLLINLDNDEATGEAHHGVAGVDVAADFSPQPGGTGVMVRRFPRPSGGSSMQPSAAIGLLFAPRFADTRFEIRVDRALSRRVTVKFVFAVGTAVRDVTNAIVVPLPAFSPIVAGFDDQASAADPLRREAGTAFRVVVWNTAGMPTQQAPAFRRILTAIGADVLMLDEVSRRRAVVGFDDALPAGAGLSPWRRVVSAGGGGQRATVSARAGLRLEPAFALVRRPQADFVAREAHGAAVDRWSVTGASAEEQGAGAAGAVIVMDGRRLLAVSADLACCGSPEEPGEADRVLQAEAIRAVARHVLDTSRIDGVLVGGDFNLVGARDPLDILRHGLDPASGALAVVAATDLVGVSANTWRNPGARFPPGRLDWLLHSASSLSVARAFIFDTAHIGPYWLARHGLRASDSDRAPWSTSDHLPIVADFRWTR